MNDEEDVYKEEGVDRRGEEIDIKSQNFVAWTVLFLVIILVGALFLGLFTTILELPHG